VTRALFPQAVCRVQLSVHSPASIIKRTYRLPFPTACTLLLYFACAKPCSPDNSPVLHQRSLINKPVVQHAFQQQHQPEQEPAGPLWDSAPLCTWWGSRRSQMQHGATVEGSEGRISTLSCRAGELRGWFGSLLATMYCCAWPSIWRHRPGEYQLLSKAILETIICAPLAAEHAVCYNSISVWQ